MEKKRNLWTASVLPTVIGDPEYYINKYNISTGKNIKVPFTFESINATFYEKGKVALGSGNTIMVFKITNMQDYIDFSKWVIKESIDKFEK